MYKKHLQLIVRNWLDVDVQQVAYLEFGRNDASKPQ
jgi:hypothetical protein